MIRAVAEHHHALREWARHRRTVDVPPTLLTFDHHTDTLPAFGRAARSEEERREWIAAFDYHSDASVDAALALLRHDEHIDLALRAGVVSRAVIIAHADHSGCANPAIQVCADASWPEMQLLLNDPSLFRPLADSFLTSSFLESRLKEAEYEPEPGFIFDLDCDAILTEKALHPPDSNCLKELLKSAGLITISHEEDWLKLLKLDSQLTCNKIVDAIRHLTVI